MILTIHTSDELNAHLATLDDATAKAMTVLRAAVTPREVLRRMKFEPIGFHPISHQPLNLIEQINQTFTFMVALKATEWLLHRHPDAGGFHLAPGASFAQPLDIMSVEPGLVGAESFAAVSPNNNGKLVKDLKKLAGAAETYRYAFFYAPNFPFGRVTHLEKITGVEVHCVEI
ncbi:hypothetical protein ASD21_05310 [Caulobacter sp. Root1455]|uniref:hypothetical protein n=1 Tax=Caulobacter sp. Root1455 TaxID=1736465 RepID=UPI000700EA31|nr:hypothetical protein [Caulobacter sp. Root1455]KQY95929.1 hypothetical protein ASD21_05310 [Caulobacter sp. Root1455]